MDIGKEVDTDSLIYFHADLFFHVSVYRYWVTQNEMVNLSYHSVIENILSGFDLFLLVS